MKNSFSAFGSKKEKRQLVLSSVVIQNLDNTGACFPGQIGPASLPAIYDTTYCNHVVGDRKRCLVSIIWVVLTRSEVVVVHISSAPPKFLKGAEAVHKECRLARAAPRAGF